MDIWGINWDKENGFKRYSHRFGLKKRYKEIGVNMDWQRDIKK